jgi:hypothetical protein
MKKYNNKEVRVLRRSKIAWGVLFLSLAIIDILVIVGTIITLIILFLVKNLIPNSVLLVLSIGPPVILISILWYYAKEALCNYRESSDMLRRAEKEG